MTAYAFIFMQIQPCESLLNILKIPEISQFLIAILDTDQTQNQNMVSQICWKFSKDYEQIDSKHINFIIGNSI